MPETIIRRITEADVPCVVRLQHQLMDYHEALDSRIVHREDIEESFERWLRNLFTDENAVIFVAEVDGFVAGYAVGSDRDSLAYIPKRIGFIVDTCVDKAYRQRGIGAAMVVELKAWFRSRGLTTARVNAAHKNPAAQNFWRGQGGQDFSDVLHIDLAE